MKSKTLIENGWSWKKCIEQKKKEQSQEKIIKSMCNACCVSYHWIVRTPFPLVCFEAKSKLLLVEGLIATRLHAEYSCNSYNSNNSTVVSQIFTYSMCVRVHACVCVCVCVRVRVVCETYMRDRKRRRRKELQLQDLVWIKEIKYLLVFLCSWIKYQEMI